MKKYNTFIQIVANSLLIVAIIFVIIGIFADTPKGEANIGDFNTDAYNCDWKLSVDNEHSIIELPAKLENVKGKTVIIENVLPLYIDNGMQLFMRTALQNAYVYIDGELRESYSSDNLEHVRKYLPSAYVMVDLSKEDAGKNISIHFTLNTQEKINEIRIGYGNNAWFSPLFNNLSVVVVACILIVVGILAVIMHFVMKNFIKLNRTVLYLGQAMVVIGLWVISEANIRQLLFNVPSYSVVFSYMLMELIGGFVALYINEMQKHKYEKVYAVVCSTMFLQAFVNAVLHFTGVVEFYNTLIFSHAWLAIGIVVFIVTFAIDIKTQRVKKYMLSAWGMLIFVLFSGIEILGFYISDFYTIGLYESIGLIILLVITIIQTIVEEIKVIRKNMDMIKAQADMEKKMKNLFLQTVIALSEAVDASDRYTSGHSKRVAKYASMIAARMGKSKEEQEDIYCAGLLHDVGKIRIPSEIINKPGKLTDEEYNTIKIHSVTGYHILKGISDNNYIAVAAKYHHERYDGKGYPNGLSGENIPEVARIIGVADAYDAMASNRSYRNALPQDVVRSEIEKGKGTQFDPVIADIMLQMMDEDEAYSMKQADNMHRCILSVDDEAMNNKIVAHIMRDEPMYEVTSALSGKEALEILDKKAVDLILLDVNMPEMDGLETLKLIREKYQTPVVLMTSDKTLDISIEFSAYGCDNYITKPLIPLIVKEIVHNMTEQTSIES